MRVHDALDSLVREQLAQLKAIKNSPEKKCKRWKRIKVRKMSENYKWLTCLI